MSGEVKSGSQSKIKKVYDRDNPVSGEVGTGDFGGGGPPVPPPPPLPAPIIEPHNPWLRLLQHALLAILAIVADAVVGMVIMAVPAVLELWIHLIYPENHEPMVLGMVRLSFIVENISYALAIGILALGALSAMKVLRR